MKKTGFAFIAFGLLASFSIAAATVDAQEVLCLEKCRQLALENNKKLQILKENIAMADYDKKVAFSNYLPKVEVSGIYMYNSRNMALLSENAAGSLSNMGTAVQHELSQTIGGVVQTMMSDPAMLSLIASNPTLQQAVGQLLAADMSEGLNAIGSELANAFDIDTRNLYGGMVSIQEPLYMGGKIRAYNKMASYAQDLAQTQLETERQEIILATDKAYWQIVSIANKLELTRQYVELLQKMSDDIEKLVNEGLATASEQLAVKVKRNEAEMGLIKAENGLVLSKMLLCQNCGLPLDSEITLADEDIDKALLPAANVSFTEKDLMENRPELKSLKYASLIMDQKVNIARAEFLPTVAAFGNYVVSNPSCFNGFENKAGGMWNVGVMAKIPIFHWGEGLNKMRKAESEAKIARLKLDDTKEMVMLQATQYEKQIKEADARLLMTQEKLADAEENLRKASVGFREGVITTSRLNEAQTAWLQAHSDFIDTKIDRIMTSVYLQKAIGTLKH